VEGRNVAAGALNSTTDAVRVTYERGANLTGRTVQATLQRGQEVARLAAQGPERIANNTYLTITNVASGAGQGVGGVLSGARQAVTSVVQAFRNLGRRLQQRADPESNGGRSSDSVPPPSIRIRGQLLTGPGELPPLLSVGQPGACSSLPADPVSRRLARLPELLTTRFTDLTCPWSLPLPCPCCSHRQHQLLHTSQQHRQTSPDQCPAPTTAAHCAAHPASTYCITHCQYSTATSLSTSNSSCYIAATIATTTSSAPEPDLCGWTPRCPATSTSW
jgi:hypothetical protein